MQFTAHQREMKEQDLIDLGFERTDIPADESGDEAFYYYRYEITYKLCLISSCSDEVKENGWYVELFDYEDIEIRNLKDLKTLIGIVERNKKKREKINSIIEVIKADEEDGLNE